MYAVFPLSIVVLPEEKVALHLFEPRYKQLFQDHRSGKQFVILNQNSKGHADIGTLVHIDKVIEVFSDGIADIVVKGDEIIKIKDFQEYFPGKLYSAVDGEIIPKSNVLSEESIVRAKAYFNLLNKQVNWSKIHTVYDVCCELDRDEDFKQVLLACKNDTEANRLLCNEIKLLDKMHENEQALSKRFFLN